MRLLYNLDMQKIMINRDSSVNLFYCFFPFHIHSWSILNILLYSNSILPHIQCDKLAWVLEWVVPRAVFSGGNNRPRPRPQARPLPPLKDRRETNKAAKENFELIFLQNWQKCAYLETLHDARNNAQNRVKRELKALNPLYT